MPIRQKSPSFKVMACFVLEFWAIYWPGGGKHPPPPVWIGLMHLWCFSLITSEIFQLPIRYRHQFVGEVMTDILTLTRPKCFWPTPWPKGRGLSDPLPPPNSWMLEMKFWQWIHMHLRISQFFFSIAFVLFTLLPWQVMKTGGSLQRFCYSFKNSS